MISYVYLVYSSAMASEGASGAASGGQLQEKLDLSKETDAKIEQARTLVNAGQLPEALALLSALEKQCRVGNDNPSLVRVCEESLKLCRQVGDEDAMVDTIQSLVTRRSQKTSAVKALVQTALPWCVEEPFAPLPVSTDSEIAFRDRLVVVLRDVTDGKLFLERERAQLTRALATIKEQQGDISEAANVLQDVHVETYGSLSKKDKIEFILEQMRLTLAKKDFVRAAIVAGKVSKKNLAEENMETYKVQFYTLMTIYHRHDKNALDLARDYHAIYLTTHILADDVKWREALQATVVFLALSPYDNEQQDMLNRIALEENLEKLPACKKTIDLLLKKEIINYPMTHQAELEALPVCHEGGEDLAAHWHEVFHRRIIQHNIRVVSVYYKRIHGARLAQLLQLEPARVEKEIAAMVSEGSIYAKIDRPTDIVRFSQPKTAEAVLSDWASDIDKLLNLVETTTHLIDKENMTSS